MKMTLWGIDELGYDFKVNDYYIEEDLDENYLELWKQIKYDQAKERYPEARTFYFENRSEWNDIVRAMQNNPFLYFETDFEY